MTPIERARQQAAASIGISISGTAASLQDLSIPDKERVLQETAVYILDNPDEFSETQLQLAENITQASNFRDVQPVADTSITFDKVVAETAKNASKAGEAVAETAGSAVGGFVKGSPLLAAGLLVVALGVGFAVFKLK